MSFTIKHVRTNKAASFTFLWHGKDKKKKQRFRDLMQDVVSRFNRFVPVSHEVGLSTSAAPEIQFWSQIWRVQRANELFLGVCFVFVF